MIKYLPAFLSIITLAFCMTCSSKNTTQTITDIHQYVEISDAINDLYTNDTLDTMYYNFIDIKRACIFSNDSELICTLVVAGFPDTLWLKNTTLYGDTIHGAPNWMVFFDFWGTPLTYEDLRLNIYFYWGSEGRPVYLTSLKTNYSAEVCWWMEIDRNIRQEVSIPARFFQMDSMLVIHFSDQEVMELEKDILHSDIYIETSFRNKRDEVSRKR